MTVFAIFCGSRYWTDREKIREVLSGLPSDATIIHGDAPGADSIAGWEAECTGRDVIAMPALWETLGDAAGPERNERMLRLLLWVRDLGQEIMVVAFHEDPELGKGTRDMVNRARRAGVPIHTHR